MRAESPRFAGWDYTARCMWRRYADAANPSQAAAVEDDRHRERSACDLAQLRPQGRCGGNGEVRGADQGAGPESAAVLQFRCRTLSGAPSRVAEVLALIAS